MLEHLDFLDERESLVTDSLSTVHTVNDEVISTLTQHTELLYTLNTDLLCYVFFTAVFLKKSILYR